MGRSFESFGFMIIGGMASATLFTLLAVPVYTLIDDARAGAAKHPCHGFWPLAQNKRGGVTCSALANVSVCGLRR